MISFLALRELTFRTDEIGKQSNAISMNSESATKEGKAGLKSGVRGQERDQARVGDENAGFAAAEGSWWAGAAEPQLGAGWLSRCTQWTCRPPGFPGASHAQEGATGG